MFRNIAQKLKKEHLLGGFLVSGTLYFGYKNVSAYFGRDSGNDDTSLGFKAEENDLLSENLKKLYNSFNKKDLSLRNGDLVFIKYNLEALNFFNRYKMRMVRNLSKNRIYDDLGIVYRLDDNYYIIMLPSVKIKSKSVVRDLNIDDKKSRGVIAIEYDDLVKENHPDLISIRRLICSESTRDNVVKSLKSAVLDLKSCLNSGLVSIFNSWTVSLPYLGYDCSHFINALTYREELEFAKKSLNYTASDIFKNVQTSFESKMDGKVEKPSKKQDEEGAEFLIDNLIEYEKTMKDYDKDLKTYEQVIENFLEKVKNSKAKEGSRLFGTETSLVSKVYSKSRLLPLKNMTRLFNIYNYFELDSLYNSLDSDDPNKYSRLSSPFNVYTGGVNRIRFQNLKCPQIRDILEFRV